MDLPAAIRADAVNFPLFVHVLGAMVLVGALITVAATTAWGARADGSGLVRFGLRTVLLGVLPAYIVMRVGAQWTEAEENLPPEIEDQAWLTIGYITADLGALLVIVSAVLAFLGLRRLDASGGQRQARAISIIALILLAVFVFAVWAMTAKPG